MRAYLGVASDRSSADGHRDDARLWAGSSYRDLGRVDDARRLWRDVANEARDPFDRILAFDHLGLLWIDEGDLAAAAGTLHQCLLRHGELASEETKLGERVRKSLQRMRVVEALQRKVKTPPLVR